MPRFYHNITAKKFNLDLEELVNSYKLGDKLMFTESGDAIVKEPDQEMKSNFEKEILNSFSVHLKSDNI